MACCRPAGSPDHQLTCRTSAGCREGKNTSEAGLGKHIIIIVVLVAALVVCSQTLTVVVFGCSHGDCGAPGPPARLLPAGGASVELQSQTRI